MSGVGEPHIRVRSTHDHGLRIQAPESGVSDPHAAALSRLLVSVLTSLGGFYQGPGHDLSVLPFEDAFNDHVLRLLRAAGTRFS